MLHRQLSISGTLCYAIRELQSLCRDALVCHNISKAHHQYIQGICLVQDAYLRVYWGTLGVHIFEVLAPQGLVPLACLAVRVMSVTPVASSGACPRAIVGGIVAYGQQCCGVWHTMDSSVVAYGQQARSHPASGQTNGALLVLPSKHTLALPVGASFLIE